MRNCVVGGVTLPPCDIPIVPPALVAVALVGNMYYQQSEAGKTNSQWGLIRRTTLGFLTSPTRELTVVGEEWRYRLQASPLLNLNRLPTFLPSTDRWSPYEIALFESAICLVSASDGFSPSPTELYAHPAPFMSCFFLGIQVGKNFSQIAGVIKTKQPGDCVEFYYVWKKTKNYAEWKRNYKHVFGACALLAAGMGACTLARITCHCRLRDVMGVKGPHS